MLYGLSDEQIEEEARRATFADARHNKRWCKLVKALSDEPSKSLPKAISTPKELERAYALLKNKKVTVKQMLSGHQQLLRERVREEKRVLMIHDTTCFSYPDGGKKTGLGHRRSKAKQSFFSHVSLVLEGNGTRRALGIAGLFNWVRELRKGSGIYEHGRWANAVDASEKLLSPMPILHVMDREASDYGLMARMNAKGQKFVVRAYQDILRAAQS